MQIFSKPRPQKGNVVDLRKMVHSVPHCAEVCQPPTSKGEYIVGKLKNLSFGRKSNYFNYPKMYSPLGVGGSEAYGSPARGATWVENNGPDVFQSPVGTRYGYPERHDTHIASLKGLWKLRKSTFSTHVAPLAGLEAFRSTPLIFFLLLFFNSCTPKPQNFQLQVSLRNSQPCTFYLYRLSEKDSPALVDSFQNTQLDAQFTLTDPALWREAIYQLSIPNLRNSLYFIGDVPNIQTNIDGVEPRRYTTRGSRGSFAIQNLQHIQNPLQDSLTILNNKINNKIGDQATLLAAFGILSQQMKDNYFRFADTTTSPLAALFISQQLDFGNDRARHKAFITRLEKRFKKHSQLAAFIQKTKDFLALFEVEYEIGDSLPSASFADRDGRVQSPAQWRGGYYLLEFWSSYCSPCLFNLEQKKAVYEKYHPTGFNMLAFSLDEDQEMLKITLQNGQYPWPVVADLKGWGSQAVNTYKIDSIPYNILVGPNGKIIGKNVDAKTLEGFLKRAK